MTKYKGRLSSNIAEPLISIIVPVYQVASYLRACLDSILEQSYANFELILVDDGSTDGSEVICDEYVAKDSRIKVIHQQNAGLSAARNAGLDTMKGEYIAFVDSDDVLLHTDYLKTLLHVLEETDSEISVCGSLLLDDIGTTPEPSHRPEPNQMFEGVKLVSGREVLLGYGIKVGGYYSFACTARLFRRECFENLRFPIGITSEDDAISAELLLDIEKIAYSGWAMYGYRMRWGSITHTRGRLAYYRDQIRIADWHRKFYISCSESELAELSRQRIERNKLLFLLSCKNSEEMGMGSLSDIDCPNPEQTIRSIPRAFLWDMIRRYDKEDLSILEKHFFRDELSRVKTIMALIKSLLFNERNISWNSIYPDIQNIISMACDNNLAVLVTRALRAYDELPERRRIKYEAFENQAIRNAFQSSNDFAALYPHPWYREKRDESQISLADIVDAFLLISTIGGAEGDGLTKNDLSRRDLANKDLIKNIKEKFRERFDIVITLQYKLFANDSHYESYSKAEEQLLLEILNSHAYRK